MFLIYYEQIFFRECINRVCEAAGLKSADKKRRVCILLIFTFIIAALHLY